MSCTQHSPREFAPRVILQGANHCICHKCMGHADLGLTLTAGKPLRRMCPQTPAGGPQDASTPGGRQQLAKSVLPASSAAGRSESDSYGTSRLAQIWHKVPPASAGYTALSMTVMATLFGSSAAASQSPQWPMWPQPNAITASGLTPPGVIPMQPRALALLPLLPADPNMTSVNSNQISCTIHHNHHKRLYSSILPLCNPFHQCQQTQT